MCGVFFSSSRSSTSSAVGFGIGLGYAPSQRLEMVSTISSLPRSLHNHRIDVVAVGAGEEATFPRLTTMESASNVMKMGFGGMCGGAVDSQDFEKAAWFLLVADDAH